MAARNGIRDLINSFFKYLIAGGIAFVVDFSTFELCHRLLGIHYLLAATIGFSLGLLITYICSNKFVFSQRKMADKQAAEFTIFAIIGLVGLALTNLFMWVFVSLCSEVWVMLGVGAFAAELAKLVTEGIVLLWNFGARKVILY